MEIMNHFATDKEYKMICENHAKGRGIDVADDLYQELFIKLWEKPVHLLQRLYNRGELKSYVIGVINRMFQSGDRFYNNQIKLLADCDLENVEIPEDEISIDLTSLTQKVLNDLAEKTPFGRYDKNMMEMYLKYGSYQAVHNHDKKFKRDYISAAVKRAEEYIKQGIKKEYPELAEMKNMKKIGKKQVKKDKDMAEAKIKNQQNQFMYVLQNDGKYKRMSVEEYNSTRTNPYGK